MDEHERWVHELCARMREDITALMVQAVMALQVKCGLSDEQGKDMVVPVLSAFARDVVHESLDLCLELVHEQQREHERQ